MNRRVHADPIIIVPEAEEIEEPAAPVIVRGRQRGRVDVFERFVAAMRDQNGLVEMDVRAQAGAQVIIEANPEEYNSEDDDSDDEVHHGAWDAYDDNDRLNDLNRLNELNRVGAPAIRQNVRALPELVDEDEQLDHPQIQYRNLRPGVADERFWKIIESFNWRNRTDGVISKHDLERVTRRLTRLDEQIFRIKMKEYYEMLHEKLSHDGMFENVTVAGQHKTVSHMIALGLQIYNTVLEDATFVYILVEQGDCQSLLDILPINLKVDLD